MKDNASWVKQAFSICIWEITIPNLSFVSVFQPARVPKLDPILQNSSSSPGGILSNTSLDQSSSYPTSTYHRQLETASPIFNRPGMLSHHRSTSVPPGCSTLSRHFSQNGSFDSVSWSICCSTWDFILFN